jgi:hypothetical protein
MTCADIINMAREAGTTGKDQVWFTLAEVERFAALVAAAEREACAKAADDQWVKNPNVSGGDAIRARNQQTGAAS